MMSLESQGSIKEFRKLLREYSQYSINLKNWLYEDLTSIMGQSPPGWFFESVYKDAHAPLIYWMKDKPGITSSEDTNSSSLEKESIEDLIVEFGLIRDGPIVRVGSPISSAQLQDLKARFRKLGYEFLDAKGVFRPKWNGLKK